MAKIYKISFNTSDLKSSVPLSAGFKSMILLNNRLESSDSENQLDRFFGKMSAEHASRFYLESFIIGTEKESIYNITSPDRPQLVPDFVLKSSAEEKLNDTTVVEFQQYDHEIPIFGTSSIVEIEGANKSLRSIEANVSERPTISPIAKLSPAEGLNKIYSFGELDAKQPKPDLSFKLVFFPFEDVWRLAYHFPSLPVFPPDFDKEIEIDEKPSPRLYSPYHDYFVDAHSGDVFYYFSSGPNCSTRKV